MERIINPYRLIQILLVLFTWTGMILNGYDYDSVMLYVNISLFGNLLLVLWNSGLISTKFILTFLIYSIAMVPGIAYYLLDFKLYSYVNFDHQLNDSVTIQMLWLMFLSSNFYTFITLAKDTKLPDLSVPIKNETRLPFAFMCLLILLFTYLGNPGETLITINYKEIYKQRSALATIASIASIVFWVDAYGKTRVFRSQGDYNKIKIFWAVTFVMALWLVLHARRTEAVGIISMLLIDRKLVTKKTPYKAILFAIFVVLLLYIVGYARSHAITNINLMDTIQFAFQTSFEGGGSKTEFANMPSGLGNITATMQTSVYHFGYKGEPLLNGHTVFTYPFKLIPTVIVTSANLADPATYFYQNLVLEHYEYNGGMFLYAPAYGNFGTAGMIIASIFMGLLINWTQKSIRSYNYINIVFAATIIFTFIYVTWYNFVPLPKTILYNAIVLFYVAMIFSKKRNKSMLNTTPLTA